jgi:hypothetical protein
LLPEVEQEPDLVLAPNHRGKPSRVPRLETGADRRICR